MKLTINSVKQVKGQLYGYERFPFQSNPAVIQHSNEAIKLHIKGTLENGKEVMFYTPNVTVKITEGMLNCKRIKQNDWFTLIEQKTVAYKNGQYYEGAMVNNPPAYLHTPSVIKPTVKAGDVIDINFKVKKQLNNTLILWYVKLIK